MNIMKRLLTTLMIIAALLVYVPGQSKRSKTGPPANQQKPSTPSSGAPTATPETPPFASKDGRFSISPPPNFETFDQTTESHQTPYGEALTVVTYKAKEASGNDFRDGLVMYIDYPRRIFREQSLSQILKTALKGTLASLGKATILKEERFMWSLDTQVRTPVRKDAFGDEELAPAETDQVPGISVLVSVQDGVGRTYGRFDFLVVKPRAYAVALVYSNRAAFNRPAVKNYFNSFRVTRAPGK